MIPYRGGSQDLTRFCIYLEGCKGRDLLNVEPVSDDIIMGWRLGRCTSNKLQDGAKAAGSRTTLRTTDLQGSVQH